MSTTYNGMGMTLLLQRQVMMALISTVEVEDVNIDLPTDTLALLRQNIDPLQHSDSFEIDLFQNGLLLLMQAEE